MHDKKLEKIIQVVADVLPEPVPPLLSAPPPPPNSSLTQLAPSIDSESFVVPTGFIDTPKNSFGMFRWYYGTKLPTHDPEREINLAMLSNISEQTAIMESGCTDPYHPYPNRVSFLLGNWYWNGGSQKSQADFDSLMEIIGNENFSAADIKDTRWRKINAQLSLSGWDKGEWHDEDAGWQKSSIKIKVPFHYLTNVPGVKGFTVDDFYHRSLVSIVRERIRNDARDNAHFHFEPFELLWLPHNQGTGAGPEPTRLQGELYTSPAFMTAHQELQAATGESGCLLPRVIVGLMFWSDATHLTNFGNSKLWPLYMSFGNDSKYQRCKPSRNMCEHVGYFEQVRRPGLYCS